MKKTVITNVKKTSWWHRLAIVSNNRLPAVTLIFLGLPFWLPAQTLEHEWSFNENGGTTAFDSIGGSNITLFGNTSLGGGVLTLPATSQGDYAQFPNGMLSTYHSITIETWMTDNAGTTWARAWSFGGSSTGPNDNFIQDNYIDLIPTAGNQGGIWTELRQNYNTQDIVDNGNAPMPTGVEKYIAVTYNAQSQTVVMYSGGAQIALGTGIATTPASFGFTYNNYIGLDQYNDPVFNGSFDEMRIWNGVVSQRYLAASGLLGPSVLVTNLTPTSASVTAGPGVVVTGTEQATVNVTLEQTGTTNLAATSDATDWTSSDPSVLTVNSSGLITGVGPGTATVSAKVYGVSTGNSGPITVTRMTLQNRYSFVSDATDSVSGANGTLVAPNGGAAATITNGLILPGNRSGGFGYSGYVSLPSGILTNTTSLTVECWVTQNQGNGWAEIWDFGNNGNENFALIPDPENNNGNMEVAFNPNNNDIYTASAAAFPNNSEQYVCLTYNNSTLTGSLYTNGVLIATQAYPNTNYCPGGIGGPGGTTQNMLGNDVYGDWQFDGTIYEFRIWNGAVAPLYILASAAAGPGVVITNATLLSDAITLETNSMVGTQTQQAVVTGDFAQISGVPLTTLATNWTSSNPSILTVSSSGLITAQSGGSATISVTVGGVTATSASITVALTPPKITQQPAATPTAVGDSETLSVGALGGDLSYQWSIGGTPISGATNSALTLTNLTLSQSGNYTVEVYNALGTNYSNPAALAVDVNLLAHRYSFISDASDSVGGSAWNGTIVPPNGGSAATISGGLSLPGGGGGGYSGYVALPSGILTNITSLTVECWVTQNSPNGWATVWDFANNGNENFEMCPYPDNNNNNLESAFTPHGNEEDVQSTNSFPSGSEQYVCVTYNNATLAGILYLNGNQAGTRILPDTSYAPGSIGGASGTDQNWLGNDTYGDTQFQGTIYELRIWNGVIPQRQIAASALLGPSILINASNLIPTSASVTAGPGLVVTGTEQATVNVTLEQTGATNLVATVDATNWTSSRPSVLTVDSSGLITGVGVGTATVSAMVAGVPTGSSGPITVMPVTLEHRYSFVSDATDSVGGDDGTLVAPNGGASATISNGLILPGNRNGGFGFSGYVALPGGILTNTTSLTVECWVTQNQGNGWAEIWDFGNNGNENFALIPDPDNNNGNMEVAFNPNNDDIYTASAAAFPNNSEQYVCLTYNNSTLIGSLYTNGVLDASQVYPNAVFAPGSTVYSPGSIGGAGGTTQNMLGNDVYGDWQFDGTIYEFRIWNGAVSPLYVAVSAAAGPSNVVTVLKPVSVAVAVATNMGAAQTQQASVVGNFAAASGVTVTGSVTNWTSSDTNVLTVNASGLITAVGGGSATISATVAGTTGTSAVIFVPLTLGIAPSGTNVVLTWSAGTLLQAPTVLGPWTTNSAAVSPHTVAATNGSQFYKILVSP